MADSSVYILGAGASIAHTFGHYPGIDTIFQKALYLNILNRDRVQRGEMFAGVVRYVRESFGKDILSKRERLNAEELLTYLDIDLEKNPDASLLLVRQEALDLIRRTFVDSAVKDAPSTGDSEYDLLKQSLKSQDSIVTFNWDTLLDDCLGRKWLVDDSGALDKQNKLPFQDNQYANFLEHLSGYSRLTWTHATIGTPYTQYYSQKGYYFKLHGSIDWFYCNNQSCRAQSLIFPVSDFYRQHYCSDCHRELKPLIIPPILNKAFSQYPSIQNLWTTAEREIEKASDIIVWGYSLPPTDFYSTWLLRHAKYAWRISIVDPACLSKRSSPERHSPFGWNRLFTNKFLDVFGKNLRGVGGSIKFYESFADYVNDIDVVQKYGMNVPYTSKGVRRRQIKSLKPISNPRAGTT